MGSARGYDKALRAGLTLSLSKGEANHCRRLG